MILLQSNKIMYKGLSLVLNIIMSKFNIAIIEPNDVFFGQTDMHQARFKLDTILDEIEDYIVFKKVSSPEEMMNVIIEETAERAMTKNNIYMNTYTFYQNANFLYQLCYSYSPDDKADGLTKNGIASYLNEEHITLYGKSAIIKSRLLPDNTCVNESMTMKEIAEVFINRFLFKGVVLEADGKMHEFTYMQNPVDCLNETDRKNMKFYEYNILGNVFMVFIEIEPTNTQINYNAVILTNIKIEGRVMVAVRRISELESMNDYYNYTNIDHETLRKLLSLLALSQDNTLLVDSDDMSNITVKTEDGEGTKKKYNNFYRIIDVRFNTQNEPELNYNNVKLDDASESLNKQTLDKAKAASTD